MYWEDSTSKHNIVTSISFHFFFLSSIPGRTSYLVFSLVIEENYRKLQRFILRTNPSKRYSHTHNHLSKYFLKRKFKLLNKNNQGTKPCVFLTHLCIYKTKDIYLCWVTAIEKYLAPPQTCQNG